MKKIIIIINLFILISCSSDPVAPTPESKEYKSLDIEKQKILNNWDKVFKEALYHEKTRGRKKACSLFQTLSKENDFPLKDLAIIKKIKLCTLSRNEYHEIWKNFKPKAWLRKKYLKVISSKLKNVLTYNFLPLIYIERAKEEEEKKEKEKLIFVAVQLAEVLKDQKIKNLVSSHSEKISPRFIKSPNSKNYYQIAIDYDWNREFKKARKYYRKAIEESDLNFLEQKKVWFRIAYTYKKERGIKKSRIKYLITLQKASKFFKTKNQINIQHYFDILVARELWTTNYTSKAITTLKKISKSKSISSFNDAKTKWLLAEIYLEKKQYKKAETFLNSIKTMNFKDTEDLKYHIYWTHGFNYFLNNKFKKANIVFQEAISSDIEKTKKAKFYFWSMVTSKHLGQSGEVNDLKEMIKENYPNNYYHYLLAINENEILPPIKCNINIKPFNDNTLSWLSLYDLKDLTKSYLVHLVKNTTHEESEMIALMKAFERAGAYKEKLKLFFRIDSEEQENIYRSCPQIVFPTPYREEIKKFTSNKNTIPLIYSIMRQESLFDSFARSPADAFGLLQLIPSTAKRYAKKAGVKLRNNEKLYNPKINIKIASRLIDDLLNYQNNNILLTAASYNAGRTPVTKWKRNRFKKHYDFINIEKIPYKETRKYVKLVFRNYLTYLRILSGKKLAVNQSIINL